MSDQLTVGHSGDTYGRPGASRETPKAEIKERARERVRGGARRGEPPSVWSASDLEWAFGNSEAAHAELQQLAEQAAAVHQAKVRRAVGGSTSSKVRGRAELLVQRWHRERDEAELALAVKQVRRELGLDPEPQKKEA